jgi:hypothetical protein
MIAAHVALAAPLTTVGHVVVANKHSTTIPSPLTALAILVMVRCMS